jgi:Fe-S-cluster containining protein
MRDVDTTPELDVRLLSGLAFACRPDCGLCCYAEPRASARERSALVQIVPEAEFVLRGSVECVASRPNGGACQFLRSNRCGVHRARPSPCREFPVTVHVGTRLQASAVLSCPGVDATRLVGFDPRQAATEPAGFENELEAVRGRISGATSRRVEGSARRRQRLRRELTGQGRWADEADVRATLGARLPFPTVDDFPAEDPPSAEDGLERLPLFFDGRAGPVALAQGIGGWEVHELSPEGGFVRAVAVVPPPARLPPLRPDARSLVEGYLRYWLERDAFFGAVHLAMLESADGTVAEWAAAELRAIGALTITRAEVRAKTRRGDVDALTAADLVDGIRATDQDLLDRESWGEPL